MSCGVGRRCSSDPALLWLWRSLVATALIRPLAWEPPYETGAALEKIKKKKRILRTEHKTKVIPGQKKKHSFSESGYPKQYFEHQEASTRP